MNKPTTITLTLNSGRRTEITVDGQLGDYIVHRTPATPGGDWTVTRLTPDTAEVEDPTALRAVAVGLTRTAAYHLAMLCHRAPPKSLDDINALVSNCESVPTTESLDEYAFLIGATAVYPREVELSYLCHGLTEEMCELAAAADAGILWTSDGRDQIIAEAGDIMWYATRLASWVGHTSPIPPAQIDVPMAPATLTATVRLLAGAGKRSHRDAAAPDFAVILSCVDRARDGAVDAVMDTSDISEETDALTLIINNNLAKLWSRAARGTIHGAGGDR